MTESLGEAASRVRVRRLVQDETFLLAALHLQSLRRRGIDGAGHVQDLGMRWHERADDFPAWVAELGDQHVGLAICRLPVLPHVGRAVPEVVCLEALTPGPGEAGAQSATSEPVTLALVRAVVTWGGREGHPCVDVAPEVVLPGPVLDAARADVLSARRVSLPTRP